MFSLYTHLFSLAEDLSAVVAPSGDVLEAHSYKFVSFFSVGFDFGYELVVILSEQVGF
jgi:hypothetical protein